MKKVICLAILFVLMSCSIYASTFTSININRTLKVSGNTTLTGTVEGLLKLQPLSSAEVKALTSTTTPEGTLWIDKNAKKFKVFINNAWKSVSFEAQ